MFRRKKWAAVGALASALTVFGSGAASASGGWTTVSVPATGNNVILGGVFARTDTDAWAVGTQYGAGGTTPPPVTYHWNGTTWSLVGTPALGVSGLLVAVSASSAADAWAVGWEVPRRHQYRTLLEHWNGTAWSVDTADSITGGADFLSGVVDLSASNAYAIGVSDTGTLLEHWNGTAWSQVAIPDASFHQGAGQAISATSASDIWMVGSGTAGAEALHFNGTAWAVVPMQQPAPNGANIEAVTAISPTDAWAVGEQSGPTAAVGGSTLTEHWNGTSWTIVPSPTPGADPSLTGIAARSGSDVIAVGTGLPSVNGGLDQAVILRWNGTSWSDDIGGTINKSLSAAATFPGAAREWAVGYDSNNQGLVLSHG